MRIVYFVCAKYTKARGYKCTQKNTKNSKKRPATRQNPPSLQRIKSHASLSLLQWEKVDLPQAKTDEVFANLIVHSPKWDISMT